jgi:cell division protein FtsL
MFWRLLHIAVLAALVLAAADVYKIKYESTLQAEKVAKLRTEMRREQDAIALLRAEWAKLDRPDRLQELAQRHLTLKPIESRHYDRLDRLPERPPQIVAPDSTDPIGDVIDTLADPEVLTGSVPR